MKIIATIFVTLFAFYSVSGLECNGLNEVVVEYTPICPIQCNNIHQIRCLGLIKKASCQCSNGTIRDTTSGKCVKESECPKNAEQNVCNGENEEFRELVSACPPTCAHPVGPLCQAMIHKPSCVCTKGTVRDTINNKCVKTDNCPKEFEEKTIVCNGLNEKFSEWVSACPDVCPKVNQFSPMKCLAIVHKPSCVCINGTIRDTINERCVAPNECPK